MNHQLLKLVENGNMQVVKLANMLLKFSHMLQMKVLQSMYYIVYVVLPIIVFRRTLKWTRTTITHPFVDALGVWHNDGTFLISNGDVIVMDNCVFHHGRNTEP